MKKEKDEITTTELAGMIARGFASIQNEFLEFKHELSTKMQSLETTVKIISKDVHDLKKEVREINERFVPWYAFDSLSKRVDLLENKE